MINKPKYAFKKDNDDLVYIDDVENGLKCNCYCKECGEDLIAKNNGTINEHHFSHSSKSNCSSGETFIHYFSKFILSEMDEFYLPEETISYLAEDNLGYKFLDKKTCFGKSYKILNCYIEKIVKEESENEYIRPDIIFELDIEGKTYSFLIEVAVTHFIDNNKLKYIKKKNLNCLEINLNHIKNNNLWDKDFLKSEVLKTDNTKLINQSIYDNYYLYYEIDEVIFQKIPYDKAGTLEKYLDSKITIYDYDRYYDLTIKNVELIKLDKVIFFSLTTDLGKKISIISKNTSKSILQKLSSLNYYIYYCDSLSLNSLYEFFKSVTNSYPRGRFEKINSLKVYRHNGFLYLSN